MNDKIKLADGSDWDNITDFTGASHMYATSDYEFLCLCLRRKKQEEKITQTGHRFEDYKCPDCGSTLYPNHLCSVKHDIITIERRVEELEKAEEKNFATRCIVERLEQISKIHSELSDIRAARLDALEKWRKAE